MLEGVGYLKTFYRWIKAKRASYSVAALFHSLEMILTSISSEFSRYGARLVVASIGFQVGQYLFVQDSYHERAAVVIDVVDIIVHAVDAPHLPQESLRVPWNCGLAVELGNAA